MPHGLIKACPKWYFCVYLYLRCHSIDEWWSNHSCQGAKSIAYPKQLSWISTVTHCIAHLGAEQKGCTPYKRWWSNGTKNATQNGKRYFQPKYILCMLHYYAYTCYLSRMRCEDSNCLSILMHFCAWKDKKTWTKTLLGNEKLRTPMSSIAHNNKNMFVRTWSCPP